MSHLGLSPVSTAAGLYGRDNETQLLLGSLLHDRTVLLYGASGIGKTSLIKVSLAPLLRSYVFSPLFSTNQTDDKESPPTFFQDVTCFSFEPLDDQIRSTEELKALVRKEPSPARCLIFDRLDALTDKPDNLTRASVMSYLAELERDQSTWLLLSIREEALPEFERRFADLYPRLFQTLLRLNGIKETSVRPQFDSQLAAARSANVQLHSLATDKIFGAIRTSDDLVDPLRLAMAQEMIADAIQPGMSAPNWGNLDDISVSYYEHQLKKAFIQWNNSPMTRPLDEFVVRLSLEKHFIAKGETRLAPSIIDGRDAPLLQSFYDLLASDCRLLRSQKNGATVTYTLSHDRLIPAVRSANRAWVESHQPLAVSSARWWKLHDRPASALLRGRSLRIARGWVRRLERYEGLHSMFAWEEIVDFVNQSRRRQLRRYLQFILLLLSSLSAGAYGSALLIAEHQRLQTYELEAGVHLRSVGKTARIGSDASYPLTPDMELENLICRAQTDILESELDRLHKKPNNALKLITAPADVQLLKRCKMVLDDLEGFNKEFKSIQEVLMPSGHDASKPSASPRSVPGRPSVSTKNNRGVKPAGKIPPKRRASTIVP